MQNIYSYIFSKFTFQNKSRPRLHIREICEICERIKIYSKFTFYLLSKTTHIIYFPKPRAAQGSISVKSVRELKFTPNLLAIYFLNQPHHLLSKTKSRPRLPPANEIQKIYSYISPNLLSKTKSRPRLHIREICEICERIKIYSKFTFYLLSKTTPRFTFPNPPFLRHGDKQRMNIIIDKSRTSLWTKEAY